MNIIIHTGNIRKFYFIAFITLFGSIVFAGPDNIAPLAKVTVSVELNSNYSASNVNDGIIGISDLGEWASDSRMGFWGGINYPWVQLEWEETQLIDKILIYDRVSKDTHLAGGTIMFSDGTELGVYLIPNDGSACVIEFPPKEVDWFKFVVTDGEGDNLGLSEIEVFPSTAGSLDPVSLVDPFIETTRGRYFYFITGGLPYGMIGSAPLTRNKNQVGGGYNYNSTEILSFPQIHGWMLSGLEFMPTTGKINPSEWHKGWKSEFSHNSELVQPGYHRVFLDRYKIWVEQTATDRVSFYRLRYTEDAISNVLMNLGGYVGTSTMTGADVRKVSDTEVEGSFNSVGRIWGGPEKARIFFAMKFDKPMEQLDGWNVEEKLKDIDHLKAADVSTPFRENGASYHNALTAGVSAVYNIKKGDELRVKIAVSYTSMENAWENMESDCDHWDFDKVREDARRVWNDEMGKIAVKGGSRDQRVKFYTDLWHVLLGRHKLNDYSGDYPDYTEETQRGATVKSGLKVRTLPKNQDGTVKYNMYNSDAFWLTQWNLNILWGLAWPEVLDDFAASLVQYADNGKLLPRGPCLGGYSYIMTGCPATNLIVSTYMKGLLHKVDPEHAFKIMKQNHMPGGMMGGDEINFYVKNGWRPGNAGVTLEWAFQDWALSQMAIKLGHKRDAKYFLKRSSGWKNLYHPEVGLVLPKDEDGKWIHTDPLWGRGFIEANAWQATWSVSHDIPGLASLMGGNDSLCNRLNYAFEMAEPSHFVYSYNVGHVSYANQPGCSNAHVFNYAGKPWLSQYWVRKVNEQAYGGVTPDKGYGGHDEDQGQMGGVSALMSMGLFSLKGNTAVEPVYELTGPVFDEIVIDLNQEYYKGDNFTIKTYNNSDENMYIQKARLNGEFIDQCKFSHEQYANGGILELWMGDTPNMDWGIIK